MDPPEFKDESPAIRYIIQQVAMIESTACCIANYYKSLGEVYRRQEKLDNLLSNLNQEISGLRTAVNSKGIYDSINAGSIRISEQVKDSLRKISLEQSDLTSRKLEEIGESTAFAVAELSKTNEAAKQVHADLDVRMTETISKLDALIRAARHSMYPPLWKIYLGWLIALAAGAAIGYFVRG